MGFKRNTVLAFLSRRNFRRIPRPNLLPAMGPIWYEKSVRGQGRGRKNKGKVIQKVHRLDECLEQELGIEIPKDRSLK